MIKFNGNDLRVEYVQLKSITAALGGAARVVDVRKSKKVGKEVYARIPVDQSIVRDFVKRYKASKFLKPIDAAFIYYRKMVVAIERGPLGAHIIREKDPTWIWEPDCLKNIATLKQKAGDNSYIDGRYVYQLPDESTFTPLSKEMPFYSVPLEAVALSTLNTPAKVFGHGAVSAIAYKLKNKKFIISPALFKKHGELGIVSADKNKLYPIDTVDAQYAVNLNFILYAGKVLSNTFGHEILDPLQLPKLMVQMKTVNLPRLAREVKDTVDSHFPFTHALTWVLGIGEKAKTVKDYKTVRSVLKHLMSKGAFERSKLHLESIFRDDHDHDTVPLMTTSEALEAATSRVHVGSFTDWMIQRKKQMGVQSDEE